MVKFRVLCFEQVENIQKGFYMGGGGDRQEAIFYSGGIGPQMVGKFVGGKAAFFTETTGPDGKPLRRMLAEGNLSVSPMQLFFLVPQGKPNAPTYRVIAFDDQEKEFPMGSTRVLNLAPFPIRLNLAGKDMDPIKGGENSIYPQVKVVDEWNMFQARVDFFTQEQWVPVANQSWKSNAGKRDLVVTMFDQATKTPAIRIYQDIPPWRTAVPDAPAGGAPAPAPR